MGQSTASGGGAVGTGSATDAKPSRSPEPSTSSEDKTLVEHAAMAGLEHFIPVSKADLVGELLRPEMWPGTAVARQAARFFRYLDYWRAQTYTARLIDLQRDYEPFSPDSDLLITHKFGDAELAATQARVLKEVRYIVTHANYTFVPSADVDRILTRESHYGLDLKVDLDAFDELVIAYRGASTMSAERRRLVKFLRREEFDVPIFRRLFVLFKLKSDAQRIADLIRDKGFSQKAAEKFVQRRRSKLPKAMRDGCIYMKLFKNLPRSDLEMIFPNTEVRFRLWDKLKLGVTGSGALGAGIAGAAGKIALLFTSPFVAAGAVVGLGGLLFRQAMNVSNQRQRYMMVMAQNLYFHSMADNRSVLSKLGERAAEEDFKEEALLYTALAEMPASRADLPRIDQAIEQFLTKKFGVDVDFDVAEACERLIADGVVSEGLDGRLTCLGPDEAALLIDRHWDRVLDDLPDIAPPAPVLPDAASAIVRAA